MGSILWGRIFLGPTWGGAQMLAPKYIFEPLNIFGTIEVQNFYWAQFLGRDEHFKFALTCIKYSMSV